MKSIFAIAFFVAAAAAPSIAQTDAEKAVMLPINDLFAGMKRGDSALVHSAFMKHVAFAGIGKNKAGNPNLKHEKLQDFLVSIGTAHTEPWNELIWDTEIRIDGDFAQVYCKFAFYLGKKFSHCGIDAFHLFRNDDGKWRIFTLSDTRRKDGCDVPASVSAQLN